jgi:hypothetical protein
MKAQEERPQEFRPTRKRGLKCDGPYVEVRRGWIGERKRSGRERQRKRGREAKDNEREGDGRIHANDGGRKERRRK